MRQEKKRDLVEFVKRRYQEQHFKLRDQGFTPKQAFKETGVRMNSGNFAMQKITRGRLRLR